MQSPNRLFLIFQVTHSFDSFLFFLSIHPSLASFRHIPVEEQLRFDCIYPTHIFSPFDTHISSSSSISSTNTKDTTRNAHREKPVPVSPPSLNP
ncbi:hypothetical protein F5B20DRAFT_493307 [Whalleya microplaca]|nr:hypothetical protein F5B20DRAFT_493307 [Whalleya microplaca]